MKLVSVAVLLAGFILQGCMTPGTEEVEFLDVSQLAPDEGAFAVRFFTTMAEGDELDRPDTTPEIEYGVHFSRSTNSILPLAEVIRVDAEAGPALAVRKLPAGEYYFNELVLDHPGGLGGGPGSHLHFPIEVKFSVRPGQVTYIGDLSVHIVEEGGWLGLGGDLSCSLEVTSKPDEVQAILASRYPGLPLHLEASPMQIH